jgi:predicted RNA-binding protein with PUA-like domain
MPVKSASKPKKKAAGTSSAKSAGRAAAKAATKTAAKRKTKAAARPAPARKAPAAIVSTGYWLMKSEPDAFSWQDLKDRGKAGEPWTGVRNFLARNNMKAMRLGDLAFFYHSNIGKEIVGIARVSALAHPDPDDTTGTWECVDVIAVTDLPKPVTLADVKDNPKLAAMSLVTSMRLSVQPVTPAEWQEVCRMAGLDPASLA